MASRILLTLLRCASGLLLLSPLLSVSSLDSASLRLVPLRVDQQALTVLPLRTNQVGFSNLQILRGGGKKDPKESKKLKEDSEVSTESERKSGKEEQEQEQEQEIEIAADSGKDSEEETTSETTRANDGDKVGGSESARKEEEKEKVKEDQEESRAEQKEAEDDSRAGSEQAGPRLWDAAREGDVHQILRLVEDGADVDKVDAEGMTALHHACACGHEGAIAALLNCGSSLKAPAKDGSSPLHLAVYYGHAGASKLLLNRGADVHAVDSEGSSPLHNAAYKDHVEIVTLLIDHGAELDAAQSVDGYTPLHLSCEHGCTGAALALLNRSANASIPSLDKQTPQALARRAENWELAALLALRGKGHPVEAVTPEKLSQAISFLSLCALQDEAKEGERKAGGGKEKGKGKKKGKKAGKAKSVSPARGKAAGAAAAAVEGKAGAGLGAGAGAEGAGDPWKADAVVRVLPRLPAEKQKKISWYCGQGLEVVGLLVAVGLGLWMKSGCESAWAQRVVWDRVPPKILKLLGADFSLAQVTWRLVTTGRLVLDGHTLREEDEAAAAAAAAAAGGGVGDSAPMQEEPCGELE